MFIIELSFWTRVKFLALFRIRVLSCVTVSV